MSVEELRAEYERRFEEYRRRKVELEHKIQLLRDDKAEIERYIQEVRKGVSKPGIEEIGKKLGVDIKDTPMDRMTLLLLLRKELKKKNEKLQNAERELKRIRKYLKEGVTCPRCLGLGYLTKSRIQRVDRIVQEVLETKECPLCRGSGKICITCGDEDNNYSEVARKLKKGSS